MPDAQEPEWLCVTVATNNRPALQALGAHARYFQYPLVVIGYGEVWTGFKRKLEAQRDLCRTVKPETMMVFVDAYDIIFNNNMEELKKRYKQLAKMPGQIFTQRDKRCYPVKDREGPQRARFPHHPAPFCNSGVLVGPAWAFLKVFEDVPFDEYNDDQLYWTDVILKKTDDSVTIDLDNVLSGRYGLLQPLDWKELEDKTRVLVNTKTGDQPCIIHCPGNDKYKLARLLRGTRRRGVPAAYRYPVFEIFVTAIALAFVVLVAMIVLAVLYSRQKREMCKLKGQK